MQIRFTKHGLGMRVQVLKRRGKAKIMPVAEVYVAREPSQERDTALSVFLVDQGVSAGRATIPQE